MTLTPYAEHLLARRAVVESTKRPMADFKDSKYVVNAFRVWEAGFHAFENGVPIRFCQCEHARQGWRAAAKVTEWASTGEFDKLDLGAIVEKIEFHNEL